LSARYGPLVNFIVFEKKKLLEVQRLVYGISETALVGLASMMEQSFPNSPFSVSNSPDRSWERRRVVLKNTT
jgi:hypothetical protein